MFSRKAAVPVALVATLFLSACGSSGSSGGGTAASPVPITGASQSSTTPTPEPSTPQPTTDDVYGDTVTSERGNLVKELGQPAGVTNEAGATLAQFTITAIEPNFQCTSDYASPAKNGNFIAITMDIQTTPDLANEEFVTSISITPYDFKVIGPDGTRENDSVGDAYACLAETESLPLSIGPAEHVVGKVVIDSQHTSGALVLSPSWFSSPSGWEWVF